MSPLLFFIAASILALIYAFWNGANDRANSIATIVKTKALTYYQAVILAGILNFAGPLVTTAVAKTLAKGIVPPEYITQPIVLGGITGAIVWAAFTTWRGIPVSITHSLVGGIMGAGIAAGGLKILAWNILFSKILLGIALAPIVGFFGGAILLIAIKQFTYHFLPNLSLGKANSFWRRGQIISSSFLSFTHGMNDGQNAIGMMALAFFTAGFTASLQIAWWMIIAGGLAIGFGTYIAGFRVMRTVGWKVAKLEPVDGFAAEMSSAATLAVKSFIGMPVSTTHVAVSGILGTAGAKKFRKINWGVIKEIILAWIFTIPIAAVIGGLSYFFFNNLFYNQ